MRTLTNTETGNISGGLELDAGGVALTALAITAAGAAMPFWAGFAMATGVGFLLIDAWYC